MSHPDRSVGPLPTVVAVVLATPVHLLTLAVAALGVRLLWLGTPLAAKVAGLLCLLLAYALRPALGDRKPVGSELDLKRCPQTATLLREVAAAVGTTAPGHVSLTTDPRADARLTGLSGRALSIGAPLWLALTGPERVALVGHQLGHLARGDVWVRRYVGGALHTLRGWEGMLAPYRPRLEMRPEDQILAMSSGTDVQSPNASAGILGDIVSVLLWPLRVLLAGYRRLVERVAAPSVRHEALHADLAAVRAAGTDATVRLLEVLLALPAVETSANRAVSTRSDIATAIAQRMAAFDAGQRSAVRNGAGADTVDAVHPSTRERLAAVESAPRAEPAVRVTTERWTAIDQELSAAVTKQLKRLADDFRHAY
ncbi:M48 family metallopeptidase [Nocardioides sp. CER19]|uniref:M48 family metallopeptidase n=1 Tax=Nocardioides sp. CER19 TaxID=3038538 RepID=UPI002449A50B|nr:M48 family metallopeptidase [Nocardioides sp. CER19]MDH2416405.1 M48 family metallopeptidase [Nocardioides sp. CER19]